MPAEGAKPSNVSDKEDWGSIPANENGAGREQMSLI